MANFTPPGAGQVRVQATCAKCGQATTLPFTPTPGRPVFCRSCFEKRGPPRGGAGSGGGGGGAGGFSGAAARPSRSTPRQRMMAQGRKGHFMYDAQAILKGSEGGMEEQHVRAFLEGLFARGARTSTEAAQDFLDEKLADNTITPKHRQQLGDLVERYSFWR